MYMYIYIVQCTAATDRPKLSKVKKNCILFIHYLFSIYIVMCFLTCIIRVLTAPPV